MIETLASIAAEARARQTAATFGHLAPKPHIKYEGTILFTHTAWGDIVLIESIFKGLDMSPWLCEDCRDFASDYCSIWSDYGVYRFKGTYKKFKNGNFHFSGKTKKLI